MVTVETHLMTRVASGDREAIASLYDRYATVLLPVAMRIVGSRSEAEDVLHDAFVTLPRRARHYVPERGGIAAWLIILVRNLSLDRTRRRAVRRQFAHDTAAQDATPYGASDPEAAVHRSGQSKRLIRALEQLPLAQQTTLRTAFFEGLSYAEIAARDGVSLGTVKSRAARALAALREALGGDELAPFETGVTRQAR